MKSIGKYVAENGRLKMILSSSRLVQRVGHRFVLGENLDDISQILEDWNKAGFGVILYPIEADSQGYIESLRFLSQMEIMGSISIRTPLKNLNLILEEAEKSRVRIEVDMRSPKTVDQTLQIYADIKKKHTDSVICLQANLYRTVSDIGQLAHLSPIVRLVKGAFNGEQAYKKKTDINSNFIRLAEMLVEMGIKTYLATHSENIINQFIKYTENRGIDRKQFGFQMLYGVRQGIQEKLCREGHDVWKYVAYGEDWVPYCVNRMLERKENIRFALESLLRG